MARQACTFGCLAGDVVVHHQVQPLADGCVSVARRNGSHLRTDSTTGSTRALVMMTHLVAAAIVVPALPRRLP